MVDEKLPEWLSVFLRSAPGATVPELGSERIKELAGRGLLHPASVTEAEIQEMSAAIISHLVATKRP